MYAVNAAPATAPAHPQPQHPQPQQQLSQQQQQQQQPAQQASPPPPAPDYTLPGTLHYLQAQWRQFERDRNDWEIERADLRARVALLEGERRAQDTVKADLMRRVKMLEFVLRHERATRLGGPQSRASPAATHSLPGTLPSHQPAPQPGHSSTGQLNISPATSVSHGVTNGQLDGLSSSVRAFTSAQAASREAEQRKRIRKFLGQCLQEINYLTYAKALRPVPDRALESVAGSGSSENDEVAGSATAFYLAKSSGAHSGQQASSLAPSLPATSDQGRAGTKSTDGPPNLPDTHASNGEDRRAETESEGSGHDRAASEASALPSSSNAIDLQRSRSLSPTRRRRVHGLDMIANADPDSAGDSSSVASSEAPPSANGTQANLRAEGEAQHWRSSGILRHHLDAIRSIAFDETRLLLVSGSDDGTVKYWNLDPARAPASTSLLDRGAESSPLAPPPTTSSSHVPPSGTQPVITYRGHTGGVTSVLVSSLNRRVYSASIDSTIRVWKTPRDDTALYAPYDPSCTVAVLGAHTDAVWQLAFLPATARAVAAQVAPPVSGGMRITDHGYLASVSADGTTKVWDLLANKVPTLKTSWTYHGTSPSIEVDKNTLPIPTAVVAYPSDWRVCLVGYSNGVVKAFEIETGTQVRVFGSEEKPMSQVNQMVIHPTLPLLFTAHEDGWIRLVQLDTGAQHALQTHHLPVTALDIDPAGLALVSGSTDGVVRFWDLAPRNQEEMDSRSDSSASSSYGSSNSTSLSFLSSATTPDDQLGAQGADSSDKVSPRFEREQCRGWAGESIATRVSSQVVCVQEVKAHSPKGQEGVLSVAYHHSAPLFACSGADGVIRTYD